MKMIKRIFSTLLVFTLMLGTFAMMITIPAGAASTADNDKSEIENHYLYNAYNTPAEKLATMTLMYTDESGRYSLYADTVSAEVACVDNRSGQILFTNPYDAATLSSKKTVSELLSQIIIVYTTNSGQKSTLYSFTDAVVNEQVKVSAIKKGIRVEYTIGREDSKKLVPMLIIEEDFKDAIMDPMQAAVDTGDLDPFQYKTFLNRWNEIDVTNMKPFLQVEWLAKYPFLKEGATVDENGKTVYPLLYEFRSNVNAADKQKSEDLIKKYTDYSFEELEEDHDRTGYEAEDTLYPAFKLSLEYYADENGMSVRMPANGLRYDMTNFTLESLSILPYIGTGNYRQDGYAFYPDGSGALFDYETIRGLQQALSISGNVYGLDYAYHDLPELKFQKIIRYPVFGLVSTEKLHTYTDANGNDVTVSATIKTETAIRDELEAAGVSNTKISTNEYKRGFLAVIESAESLATLQLSSGGTVHRYVNVQTIFNPKPKDVYDLSSTGGGTMTVVSDRKYTGSIGIRYMMLCDENVAAATNTTEYYPATWMGMAKAYRSYLTQTGVLTPLTEKDVQEDIPLYLENFGALETQETIATIPVYLMTPLTTFDNIAEMYSSLADRNIKNINFKLTGFANGGMYYTVPYALKWESAVGGKSGLQDLVDTANEINAKNDGSHMGIYPDFDFAYIHEEGMFDGLSLSDDAVKTIDNRYTSYRQYSPTQQVYVSFYQLALSPSRYSKFYTKLLSKYEQYGLKSISVSTLGTTLNTDFDEDDPYNREDSKDFTIQAFKYMQNQGYSIMTDGANAFTWSYVDHILNVDLDSSRYLESNASVPFIGVVLHGSIQFAGTPLNEEGDANYAMLRAIENGAGIYFLLSYQNTEELKNDSELSQYYSVRYDIWEDDVVKYYTELNNALKDVQTKYIIDHRFLVGERILDLDELEQDIQDQLEEAIRREEEAENDRINTALNTVTDAWNLLHGAESNLSRILSDLQSLNVKIEAATAIASTDFRANILTLKSAASALSDAKEAADGADFNTKKTALDAADAELKAAQESAANDPDFDASILLQKQEAYDAAALAFAEAEALVAAAEAAQADYDAALAAVAAQLASVHQATLDLIDYKVEADALKADADALIQAIPEAIALVQNSTAFEDDPATQQAMLAQMNAYAQNITNKGYSASINIAYNANRSALDMDNAESIYAKAIKNVEDAFVTNRFKVADEDFAAMNALCKDEFFTLDDLRLTLDHKTEIPEADEEISVETNESSYVVDNNRIVAVTYGTDSEPYKTFILNYNSYVVRVNYNGETYTIASGEYVVLNHSSQND